MSKIKQLLKSDDTVLVFDIDGVLALLEFGEYNHYDLDDEKWNQATSEGINYYDEFKVSKKMQKFLSNKNMNNIYVITASANKNEEEIKKQYVNRYYNIKKENVFNVFNKKNKIDKLKIIKEKYPELEDYKIVMIDDTVEILNVIMDNTNFSTVHISTFLDI